jgi:hypothetical protein
MWLFFLSSFVSSLTVPVSKKGIIEQCAGKCIWPPGREESPNLSPTFANEPAPNALLFTIGVVCDTTNGEIHENPF